VMMLKAMNLASWVPRFLGTLIRRNRLSYLHGKL
jgi:hypothetical protein